MAPFVAWCGRHLAKTVVLLNVTLAAVAVDCGTAAAEPAATPASPVVAAPRHTSIRVVLDQAKIIKLPERTATLVVGNPLIADVSVQNGSTLVITGKSYGVTNLVAMDRSGQILLDGSIEVQSPGGSVVFVYRGIERETYSCMPECERRITLGDTTPYFTSALTQSGTLSTQAQTVQPK